MVAFLAHALVAEPIQLIYYQDLVTSRPEPTSV